MILITLHVTEEPANKMPIESALRRAVLDAVMVSPCKVEVDDNEPGELVKIEFKTVKCCRHQQVVLTFTNGFGSDRAGVWLKNNPQNRVNRAKFRAGVREAVRDTLEEAEIFEAGFLVHERIKFRRVVGQRTNVAHDFVNPCLAPRSERQRPHSAAGQYTTGW